MSSPRFCLPIVAPELSGALSSISTNVSDYHVFEVWLDYLEGEPEDNLVKLYDATGPGRLVVVLRRLRGETCALTSGTRGDILEFCAGKDILLDLDMRVNSDELVRAERRDIKTIVSYHNYAETPDRVELEEISKELRCHNPFVSKIATYCQTPRDALRLLDLGLTMSEEGIRHIVLGMGRHGAVTRVFGTLWSNYMVFAPRELSSATAEGQLTFDQLQTIFHELPE